MSNDKRQERLVSLVRKLLELSRSNSNAHEAGLALSRAQRLMEKYGISELDATLSSVRDVASQSAPSEAEKVPEWMTRLAWAVGHAFGCRPSGVVPAFSGAVLRGLAVASFISVLLRMMVSYLEDISWTYIWGAMFLPPLAALLLCHVGWLGYSFIFWKWDYDFALFIREAVLPVVFLVRGACNFLIVPFIFLFILSPGGVE